MYITSNSLRLQFCLPSFLLCHLMSSLLLLSNMYSVVQHHNYALGKTLLSLLLGEPTPVKPFKIYRVGTNFSPQTSDVQVLKFSVSQLNVNYKAVWIFCFVFNFYWLVWFFLLVWLLYNVMLASTARSEDVV